MEAGVTSSKKMKLDISFSIEDDLMNNSTLPNINDSSSNTSSDEQYSDTSLIRKPRGYKKYSELVLYE
jgi:hypothetical protein